MAADWHTFLRIYDRCIRFGAIQDDDLDYVTKATRSLHPEPLAILLMRRIEARLDELARYGADDLDA